MNFIKEKWTRKDIEEYNQYVKSLKGTDFNCGWEQKIVKTKLECFAKTSSKAKQIAKEIKKGNFIDFINIFQYNNHMDSLLLAYLICQIKDFDLFKEYIKKFAYKADNWSSCDTLKFTKRDNEKLLDLSKELLQSDKCFVKRIGLNIFFELIKDSKYLINVFNALDLLKDEKEYYVNMCASWLLCECFIKERNKTMQYFKNNKTNSFIINKAISKCRDSYRVSKEDKDLLLSFKK